MKPKNTNQTFHESLRFPAPTSPVHVVLKKRDAANAFAEIYGLRSSIRKDIFIDSSKPRSPGPLIEIEKNGDSASKVDFLILGDGYTSSEMKKFWRATRDV